MGVQRRPLSRARLSIGDPEQKQVKVPRKEWISQALKHWACSNLRQLSAPLPRHPQHGADVFFRCEGLGLSLSKSASNSYQTAAHKSLYKF